MRASGPRAAAAGGGRWVRRLLVTAAVAGAAVALRERKLAENARRFGLPGGEPPRGA